VVAGFDHVGEVVGHVVEGGGVGCGGFVVEGEGEFVAAGAELLAFRA
jgi:hypothetical protein